MNKLILVPALAIFLASSALGEVYIPLNLDCTPTENDTDIEKVQLRQVVMSNQKGSFIVSAQSSLTVIGKDKTVEKLPIQLAVGNIFTIVASTEEKPVFENGVYQNSIILTRERDVETRATLIQDNIGIAMNCKKIEVAPVNAPAPATTSSAMPKPSVSVSNPGRINTLQTRDFNRVVESSGITVIEFKATWCGYCRAYQPVLENFAASRPDVKVYAIDIDQNARLTQAMKIEGLPTTIIFKNGKMISRQTGAMSASALNSKAR